MKSLLLTLAFALSLPALHAQKTAKPPSYIFHAYSNLMQIPVLALTEYQQPIPPGTPLGFAVSIDGGPPFPVKHVRLEDSDPISLSIVLDVSGDQQGIMPALAGAIADLAPDLLQPQDRVTVYALDCQMVRTANNIPADRTKLMRAVDDAIQSTAPHRGSQKSMCLSSLHLWDTLSYITNQASTLPGRRVILAVTDGHDNASLYSWSKVRESANNDGVAIFGLSDALYGRTGPDASSNITPVGMPNANAATTADTDYEDHFQMLTQLSGGLVLVSNLPNLTSSLQTFVHMLRNRYIVEFPRPDSLSKGPHSLLATVSDSKIPYFIRSAGTSVPIADPAILADPTTIPSDPSQAPTPGSRRILSPTH